MSVCVINIHAMDAKVIIVVNLIILFISAKRFAGIQLIFKFIEICLFDCLYFLNKIVISMAATIIWYAKKISIELLTKARIGIIPANLIVAKMVLNPLNHTNCSAPKKYPR